MKIKFNYDWTHFKYLGIPIAKNSTNSTMWGPIILKIKNKVNFQGMIWINLEGKTTLIQSFLSSYPIYSSSTTLAPRSVMNNISLEIRKFLWQGGKVQNKKFHLVNLDTVNETRSKGGLGLRDPKQLNTSLGSKLVWWHVTWDKD